MSPDSPGKVTVLDGENGYDADGQVTEWSVDTGGSDWANEILYCGYRFDPESGLYHVRHRYYHPTLGRWVTRDPVGHGVAMSLHEYSTSSPCHRRDPSGLSPIPSLGPGWDPGSPWRPDVRPDPPPWDTGVPPGFTSPPPAGRPPVPAPPPPGPVPEWFLAFQTLGCCDCQKEAVEKVMWEFLNAATDMMDMAHAKPLTWGEAIEATRSGVVGDAAGARTDLYRRLPECAQKVVDEIEGSSIMTLAAFLGWFYQGLDTYASTGEISTANAWLAQEATRSKFAGVGIGVRLRQCEQLKKLHPDWADCCKRFHKVP